MNVLRILSALLVSLLFWFCSEPEEQPCCSGIQEPVSETLTDADRVGLIWNDEFDGTSLNSDKWSFDIGDGSLQGLPGWCKGGAVEVVVKSPGCPTRKTIGKAPAVVDDIRSNGWRRHREVY